MCMQHWEAALRDAASSGATNGAARSDYASMVDEGWTIDSYVTVVTASVLVLLLVIQKGLLKSLMFFALGTVLTLIDFAIYVLTLGPFKTLSETLSTRTVFARPCGEADINGDNMPPSKVWRSVDSPVSGELTATAYPECKTTYDMLVRSYKLYASKPAQGTRTLKEWRTDEGYRFPAKVFGPTTWRTYKELGEAAHAFGSGLRALGAQQQTADVASGSDHGGILLYDDTSAEWMIAAQGAFSQDIVVATSYATLGVSSVQKAIVQGGVTVLVCNRKMLPQVVDMTASTPSLKAVVYTDVLCTPEDVSKPLPPLPKPKGSMRNLLERAPPALQLLSFDEVIAMGKAKPLAPTPPKPESIAVLMYTSGSTGEPKGVMITQTSLSACVSAVRTHIPMILEGGETYLGYLPLAHILEFVGEMYYFVTGNKIGYADPKSLLAGPERAYPTGGLEEFQPTIMVGVPKVWEAIKAGAMAKVDKAGALAKFLISLAVRRKAAANLQRRASPLFSVLLKKFKASTGGHLKVALSGGGAISAEVQEWVRTALDCPLVQGYGLTEVTGGCMMQHPLDMSIGIAGTPLPCNEVALHSEPELTDLNNKPYLTTDTLHANGERCVGRGEVWIRGPNVSLGYYKQPALTAGEFRADGFFKTGDIGMLTPSGALKIIDRKKNLVKLKGGEYVALERMNTVYNGCAVIDVEAGGVCCFADDSLDKPIALAQCKSAELAKIADDLKISYNNVDELGTLKEIQATVLKQLQEAGKKNGLTPLEIVAGVHPLTQPWLVADGCLTATQKLVPRAVYKKNATELAALKAKFAK